MTLLNGLLEALEVFAPDTQACLQDVGAYPVGTVREEEGHCVDESVIERKDNGC